MDGNQAKSGRLEPEYGVSLLPNYCTILSSAGSHESQKAFG